MSRALDPSAAASILATNPQAAYNDIIEVLNSNTTDLLDIEFLGKGYPLPQGCNVLRDGVSIGIPKLKLVQAFIVARQLFFKCLKDFKRDKFQDIRDATAVILLMDPEHITAANARKKMIQQLRTDSEAELHGVLNRERLVIDSFLTSRLHRHTKSPTLWGHRRWLLQVFCSLNLPHDIERDLQNVVLIAAERHPRNYYAWLHLRWLVQNLQEQDDGNPRGPPGLDQSNILSVVKGWCLRHPTDTSGWSFLLFHLFSIELPKSIQAETNSSICREVLGSTSSFQWAHESVWVFLRTLVASGKIQEDQRSAFFKTVHAAMAGSHTDTKARQVLKKSLDWCLDYSL